MRFLEIIMGAVAVIWTAAEILALPALLVVIGLLNDFGAAYYIISIAVYAALILLAYVIALLIRKGTNTLFAHIFGKYFRKLYKIPFAMRMGFWYRSIL